MVLDSGNSVTIRYNKTFVQYFKAYRYPTQPTAPSVSYGTPWWQYVIFVSIALISLIALSIIFIKIIRKRRILRDQQIDATQISLVRKIGSGQFGEVWLSKLKNNKNQYIDVAVKILKQNDGAVPLNSDSFLQETILLNFLRHRNIIKEIGVCLNFKDTLNKTGPVLVFEYMNGGSASDYIKSENTHLTDSDIISIFIDVCRAGEHLCKLGVIHRDIGARNILIKKNERNGKPIIAKLTDFGLAKDVGKGLGVYHVTNPDRAVFHMRYTAPEGFRGKFSNQSDVWSFGIFMWEVYTLMETGPDDSQISESPIPYPELETDQDILIALENGMRLEKPKTAPLALYEIMKQCWEKDPKSRPTFFQLIIRFEDIQNNYRVFHF